MKKRCSVGVQERFESREKGDEQEEQDREPEEPDQVVGAVTTEAAQLVAELKDLSKPALGTSVADGSWVARTNGGGGHLAGR